MGVLRTGRHSISRLSSEPPPFWSLGLHLLICYSNLVPGGWYQQIEMSVVLKSDDGSVTEGSIFHQWGKVSLEAGHKFGKDLRIHEQIKGYLQDGGFADVVETVYRWEEGIEGWSMALLTRVLNVSLRIPATVDLEAYQVPTVVVYGCATRAR